METKSISDILKNIPAATRAQVQPAAAVPGPGSDAAVAYRFSMLTKNNPQNVLILTYNHKGQLIDIAFSHDCTQAFIFNAKNETPVQITPRAGQLPAEFAHWLKVGCIIKDISNFDLSFEKFWAAYNNKVGNIARVRKKWNSLPELDRIMALGFINRMRNFYDQKGIVFPFPETYLNQRRWENIL